MVTLAAALCCLVSGTVHAAGGSPIAHAHIQLGKRSLAESDAAGHFSLQSDPGANSATISASGFGTASLDRITVREGTTLDVTLEPLAAGTLRTIGRVLVDGDLAVARGTIPSQSIARSSMDAQGALRLTEVLAATTSLTMPRPDSGSQAAVAVVALRGPDPSETLVSLDGQILNNSNTGDLDLSQFPVSPFAGVQLTEGLGPQDSIGANTIGGQVNLRSLAPTRDPHAGLIASYGSYGTSSVIANATGTRGRIGYGLALGSANTNGVLNNSPASFQNGDGSTSPLSLSTGVSTQTALANLTWSFSQRADFRVRFFAISNARNQSGALNGVLPDGTFSGPGPAFATQGINAVQVAGRLPLGSGSLFGSYQTSGTISTYAGGPTTSPYDMSYNDKLRTATLGWERSNDTLDLAFGGYSTDESLYVSNAFSSKQTQNSVAAYGRAAWNATAKLRVLGALYDSKYTTFGSSLDWRLGTVYDLDGRSDIRASAGTGFRAPLLAELYVTPLSVLTAGLPGSVDANCVAQNGNALEKPEHVTAYELGYGRRLGSATMLDVAVYRTNLRQPIEIAYPLSASCPGGVPGSAVAGQAIPINIGNAVYTGGTFRLARRIGPLLAHFDYGINVAYPLNLPASVSNPTSGANLVEHQQFVGIPIHIWTLGADYRRGDFHGGLAATYRGINNELNAGPYAVLNGAIGKQIGPVDYTLGFTNITNANAGPFTRIGAGVPYASPFGALPTDLFVQQPASVNLIISLRR